MRTRIVTILALLTILAGGVFVEAEFPGTPAAAVVAQAVPAHQAAAYYVTYSMWIPWAHYVSGYGWTVRGGAQFDGVGGDDTLDAVTCIQYAIGGNQNNPGWSGCSNDQWAYHTGSISVTVTANAGYSTYFRSYLSGCDDTYNICAVGYSAWQWLGS